MRSIFIIDFSPSDQVALFPRVVQEVQSLPWDLDVQQIPPVPPSFSDPERNVIIINKI